MITARPRICLFYAGYCGRRLVSSVAQIECSFAENLLSQFSMSYSRLDTKIVRGLPVIIYDILYDIAPIPSVPMVAKVCCS